ncbi:MAG: phosphoribosylamine--glycine ligase [Pyrinomonadaceae bacterium]
MKVLVIGSGGREHAICAAFERSGKVSKIYCAPGNSGIASIAECVPVKAEDISALAEFAAANGIGLTFVGGETALALGIVDEFEKRGLRIVGVSRRAAELEASKSFAKDFMVRHGVPTAMYKTAHSAKEAVEILESGAFGDEASPVVVKADGLAAGKGVVVAKDRAEAIKAINEMETLVGADAAGSIVLEECLFGREVSLLAFADGENFALMPPARDHKRIGEGDTGPNTGGMGTITDSTLLTDGQLEQIVEKMIKPTLEGCAAEGFPFRGIMFLGIMLAEKESAAGEAVPMLLEYNVRFGDPETQSILARLETDLADICEAVIGGTLGEMPIEWRAGNSATVVLASAGYPEKPRTGDVISGVENTSARPDVSIFHAGTSRNANGELVTSGGRVLGVTAMEDNLQEALDKAYEAACDISWEGMQYRRDIGR